jgi:hypothetical protein
LEERDSEEFQELRELVMLQDEEKALQKMFLELDREVRDY